MQSWLEQARIVSGLTIDECAHILCQTPHEYMNRENNPGLLSLNELNALMTVFNDAGKNLAWDALQDFKP